VENVRNFEDLVALMDRLRDPGGCPWDREQTYETLRGYLLEECYEVVEALDRGDRSGLREELGDLLFQVVFLSRLAKEGGHFDALDVVREIGAKMIRRHPHVFGADRLGDSDEVLRRWEEIKRSEKAALGSPPAPSVLDGVPRALPALLKSERLGKKASRVGFDWNRAEDVMEKVEEEWDEFRRAIDSGDRTRVAEELGDLLFSIANLARKLRLDAEKCLEGANAKFERRFRRLEGLLRERSLEPAAVGAEELERVWSELKDEEEPGVSAP
jgi:ATP diphosphatase